MLTKTYWINCACKNLPHMVFDKVVEDGEGSAPHLFLLNKSLIQRKQKMFIFSKFRYYFDIYYNPLRWFVNKLHLIIV